MKVNRLAAFGLAAGLLGGGAAGLALGAPGLASAQSDETTTTSAPESAEETPAEPAAPAAKPDRRRWMNDALAPLVSAGTITQSHADAVIDALQAARPARGHGPRGGHVSRGHRLHAAATALGMTAEELRTALRGGETLAEVARSQGVDPEAVVSAIVGELQSKLSEQLASGRLTEVQADKMLNKATERIRAFVHGEGKPSGFGHRGGPGRGPRSGTPPAGEGSSSSSTDGGTTTA